MTRRAALALLASKAAADEDRARRLVLDASRTLQEGEAWRFLRAFDKKRYEQYAVLRESVQALTAQRTIASSVAITTLEESPERAVLEVDWLLQLTYPRDPGKLEDRRETVRMEIDLTGKRPRITGLAPITLFRP